MRVSKTDAEKYKKAEAILSVFAAEEGMTKAQVTFYDTDTKTYTPRPDLDCSPLAFVAEELKLILGDENVVTK